MELLSPFHLIVILAVVVLLFGGRKIPEVMRGMGEGIRSFKEGMRGDAGQPGQTTATVTLTASPNPATLGQPTTLTAAISPVPTGAALGTVSFFNGSTLLGTGNVNASGVAMLVANGLPAGALSLTAAYSGTATIAGSAAALALNVNAPAAAVTT
ncbi:MAG TPA: twin-arginine translocase TatA/TatE family subunit [Candidatus Aquilonibacter sp.]|nr:twin-arginine translocase TatA/TatE family subunit [Candidatus Aquilonibacter sp.]